MVHIKNLVFCLSFLVAVGAEHCVPGIVPNLTITSGNYVQWETALNPNKCIISAYVINLFDVEDGTQFQHQTGIGARTYSLAAFDMCKIYTVEVHALTDQEVLGPSDRVNATIPPAANMNLTLSISDVTLNNNQLYLTWDAPNTTVERCITYYRVVYWDENNSPIDVYVPSKNFSLKQIPVACMEYIFQVSAIVANPDIEGPIAEVRFDGYTAVPDTPKLISLVTTNTTVNMTWKVPTYSENRCALTALVVYTVGLPVANRTALIPIQDSALRPNVNVFLESLTPNVAYTSQVHLQGVAGSSTNVTTSFQTSDKFVFNYETDVVY